MLIETHGVWKKLIGSHSDTHKPLKPEQKLNWNYFICFSGNLFDDTSALEWILNQNEHDSIEELTSPMIEKIIREAKNVVVLFCKYAGYLLIATTHTCYMLRHYAGETTVTSVVESRRLEPNENDVLVPNGNVYIEEQIPGTYLPPEKVKGLAMES